MDLYTYFLVESFKEERARIMSEISTQFDLSILNDDQKRVFFDFSKLLDNAIQGLEK